MIWKVSCNFNDFNRNQNYEVTASNFPHVEELDGQSEGFKEQVKVWS